MVRKGQDTIAVRRQDAGRIAQLGHGRTQGAPILRDDQRLVQLIAPSPVIADGNEVFLALMPQEIEHGHVVGNKGPVTIRDQRGQGPLNGRMQGLQRDAVMVKEAIRAASEGLRRAVRWGQQSKAGGGVPTHQRLDHQLRPVAEALIRKRGMSQERDDVEHAQRQEHGACHFLHLTARRR